MENRNEELQALTRTVTEIAVKLESTVQAVDIDALDPLFEEASEVARRLTDAGEAPEQAQVDLIVSSERLLRATVGTFPGLRQHQLSQPKERRETIARLEGRAFSLTRALHAGLKATYGRLIHV